MARKSFTIDGTKLSLRRNKLGLTQKEMADRLRFSESLFRALENGQNDGRVSRKNFRSIAEDFGMSVEEAERELSLPAAWDENVEVGSVQMLATEIPLFDLAIACGHWVDVVDNQAGGYHMSEAQRRQGLFRVRCRGDSMKPTIPDGVIVEFQLLTTLEGLPDFSALELGRVYYVQLQDGLGTCKTLLAVEDEQLILQARNLRRYKKPLKANIHFVSRLALARGIFSFIENL